MAQSRWTEAELPPSRFDLRSREQRFSSSLPAGEFPESLAWWAELEVSDHSFVARREGAQWWLLQDFYSVQRVPL